VNQANHGAPSATPKGAGARSVPLMIGLGCFSVLVIGCLFIVGVFVFVNAAMRSSEAYQLALAAAQRDPSVTAVLGAPVSAGWLTTGQVNVTGASGDASLEIPISGPRGSGTIAVRAHKAAGKWSFSSLNVRVSGRATPLNLLAAPTP
jgi:hypothetical protein